MTTSRCCTKGFRDVHNNARQAFRDAHEALTEAAFSNRGDEESLAAVERAFDRALVALNALAAWDRGQVERPVLRVLEGGR
jgi:hypothetical protein